MSPLTKRKYTSITLGILFFLLIPVWFFVVQPHIYLLAKDFSFSADIISYDNFYDKEEKSFLGEQRSVTTFRYETKEVENDALFIENTFDVRSLSGESIFSVRRNYVIDRKSGAHVKNPLYQDRNGYLFAPRMKGPGAIVPDKSSFNYWHVNYNEPLPMEFYKEQIISGLRVYVYESNSVIDQTNELTSSLEGVGTLYKMKLFVHFRLYVEPYTGRLVSYEDNVDAIYTDIHTGEELFPWNSFRNSVAPHSVQAIAGMVTVLKQQIIFVNIVVPLVLFVLSMISLFWLKVADSLFATNTFEPPSKGRKFWLPLILSLFVFISSIGLSYLLNNIITQQRYSEFEAEAKTFTQAVNNRLDTYKNLLEGSVGLFNASDNVSREEWKAYVNTQDVQVRYPGIQGLGYAHIVPTSTKDLFIKSVRLEGFEDFNITPEGTRDPLTSIIFLEPFDVRNRRAFGYDMFSEETRRSAMIYARDSGETSISGKITLLQETTTDIQPGFLMYKSVYSKRVATDSINNRRSEILGYVFAPFRMNDFMQGILLENQTLLGVEIYDGLNVGENNENLFFRTNNTFKGTSFTYQNTISFGNRSWTLFYTAPSSFGLDVFRRQIPLITLVLGAILAVLLYIILYITSAQRDKAIQMAHEITKDLSRVTDEAEKRANEAEKLNKLMVGREMKMIELKNKLKEKRKKSKKP